LNFGEAHHSSHDLNRPEAKRFGFIAKLGRGESEALLGY